MTVTNTSQDVRRDERDRRVRRAYQWNVIGQVFVFTLVLANDSVRNHLLDREAVGLAVAGLWLVGLLDLLGDAGLGAAIIKKTDLTDEQIGGASQAIVFLGLFWSLVLVACSPLVAWWYQNPEVKWVVIALAPVFLFQALGLAPRAVLMREMEFRLIVLVDLCAVLVTLVLTAALALAGWGAWAIVAGIVAQRMLKGLGYKWASPWRSTGRVDRSRVLELSRFGGGVAASTVITYAYSNADYLLLGRWWSEATLATYFNGFRLGNLPAMRVSSVFNRVSYPALAQLQDEPVAFERRYHQTVGQMSLVIFPIALGLLVVADDAVLALYGPQWMDAVPVVRLLAFVSATRVIRGLAPVALNARGKVRINVMIATLYGVTLVPALLFGVQYGILGVAWTWLVVTVPLNLGLTIGVTHYLGMSVLRLSLSILRPLLAAFGMAAVVSLLRLYLQSAVTGGVGAAWIRLVPEVAVGASVYLLFAWLLLPEVRAMSRKLRNAALNNVMRGDRE